MMIIVCVFGDDDHSLCAVRYAAFTQQVPFSSRVELWAPLLLLQQQQQQQQQQKRQQERPI